MDESARNERLTSIAQRMIIAWKQAPGPDDVRLLDASRASRAEIDAVNVAWGWIARIVRTAEAALLLDAAGFQVEAAPLVRSSLEHAIALHWLIDKRGPAAQALLRERANGYGKFEKAQADGWSLDGAGAELLSRAIHVETDDDTVSEDHHLNTHHRAQTYGLVGEYQAWLVETWSTHATFVSAEPYFDIGPDAGGSLHRVPVPKANTVPGGVAIALFDALDGYQVLVPSAFPGLPERWHEEISTILS